MRTRAVHILILALLVPLIVIAVPSTPNAPERDGTSADSDALAVSDALVLLDEANAKLEGHEHFGAIRRYERLLRAERFVAEAHLGLARSFLELGDLAGARDAVAQSLEAAALDEHARPETRALATELASEIEAERSRTPEVAVPELCAALEAEETRRVEALGHRHLELRTPDGASASFDLTDLSPIAALRCGDPASDDAFVVTLASPYGALIAHSHEGVDSSSASIAIPFESRAAAERVVDAFGRAVRSLTGARPATLEEESRRLVDELDQNSVCVSGEFRFAGREREHSSYSVATFRVAANAPGTLTIERTNEDVIDLEGANGESRVAWTVDLARVEWVRVVRVEKRVFGSWLVRGAVGEVTFGDLLDELEVVELGPAHHFVREPRADEGAEVRLLVPVRGDVRAVALSLQNAAQLARR